MPPLFCSATLQGRATPARGFSTILNKPKCLNVKPTQFWNLDFELCLAFELCNLSLPAQRDCHVPPNRVRYDQEVMLGIRVHLQRVIVLISTAKQYEWVILINLAS